MSERHSSATLFHIVKPNCQPSNLPKSSKNIFQNCQDKLVENTSPHSIRYVGGLDLFMKEHRRRQIKQSKGLSRHLIHIPPKKSVPKAVVSQHFDEEKTEKEKLKQHYNTSVNQTKPELYKTHESFRPTTALTGQRSSQFGTNDLGLMSRMSTAMRPTSSKVSKKSVQWANHQIKDYNNKSAMLSEISHKQPLQVRYGDRYFQYSLRDRFKEDAPATSYVYQIQQKLITGTRFVRTIKNFRPDIGNRQKMILRGKSINKSIDE